MNTTSSRLGDAANAASETMKETADYVAKTGDRMRDEFETTQRRVREIVEEYPLTCFFGAVLTGYLLGRIATRL